MILVEEFIGDDFSSGIHFVMILGEEFIGDDFRRVMHWR